MVEEKLLILFSGASSSSFKINFRFRNNYKDCATIVVTHM